MPSTPMPKRLARYAALCQEAGIVPIVEPEVLMDGAHPLERCEEVTNIVLDSVFSALFAARVVLEGMILKPNMVIPGKKCADQASPERSRRSHGAHAEAPSALRGTGHRISVRRAESDRCDVALEPHARGRALAVGSDLQLRTRAAGRRAECLGRESRADSAGGQKALFEASEAQRIGGGGAYKGGDGKSAA